MTVFVILFVNLFQNLGSGYMKLLPVIFRYICNRKKNEKIKIILYLRADLSPTHRACSPPRPPIDNIFLNLKSNI